MKKCLSMLLLLTLVLGIAQTVSAEDEKITLRIFGRQNTYSMYDDWNRMTQWQEYERRTNVHVEWTLVPASALAEKVNLALVSGDLPDVFMHSGLSNADVVKYAAEGAFIPLDELIEHHAPNFKALIDANPEYRAGITTPDGKIYTMPKLSNNLNQRVWGKLWMNQKWLDVLGKSMPTTLDELYDVLVAFRDGDPNGNGEQDEIPMSASAFELFHNMIFGAYGLYSHGYQNPYIDERNSELFFVPADERFKEGLQYMNKLYKEGLLDPEVVNSSLATLSVLCADEQTGCFYYNHTAQAGAHEADFVGNPLCLEGPHGDTVMTALAASVQGPTAFVITAANKYPERTMEWVDYLYSGEGSLLYFMGIEGESYFINDKGEVHYSDVVTHNPDGLDLDEAIALYSVWPGMDHPGLRQLKYVLDHGDGLPKAVSITEAMAPWIPEEVWTRFWYDQTDSERYLLLTSDLQTYVKQMTAEFVTGASPLDKWDEYLATLKQIGVDEYLEITGRGYATYRSAMQK